MIGAGAAKSGFGALTTLDIKEMKVMEGITFSARALFTIAGGGVLNILFDPTAFTKKELVLLPLKYNAVGGPLKVETFGGVTVTGNGTEIVPYNRNYKVGGLPETKIYHTPAGLATPSPARGTILIPSDGVGANVSGGTTDEGLVTNINPLVKYLLRITNLDGATAANISVQADFFEVV